MPCLALLLALAAPRVTLVLIWLFTQYLGRAYETAIWPLIGFFVMPVTTITYAVVRNEGGGIHDAWIVLFVLAVLIDLGVVGTSYRRRDRDRQRR